jgi:hypothetical protein
LKKFSFVLSTLFILSTHLFAADITVSGKLITWAGVNSNAKDFNDDTSDSVGYLYVNGELNTSIALTDKVTVYLEIELNDKVSNGASLNSATNKTVEIDEANVEIKELFMEALTVKIGHQYFEYTLRGNNRAMVLNDDYTGFKGTFTFEKGFLDVFYGKYIETLASVNSSDDQEVYGLHFEWNFSESIHTIFYLNNAVLDKAGADHSNYTTIGAGVDYFLFDKSLELFLEAAFQIGKISESVDQNGLGLDAGARWNFGELGSIKGLWVELNVGYRSGEDNDADSSAFWNGMTSKTGALIAESNYSNDSPMFQGYISSQYLAVRGEIKANWTEKFSSAMLIAYFDNTAEDADPYGFEIDLSNRYQHTENLGFSLHIAAFMPDDGLAVDGDTVFAAAFETSVSF